MDRKLQLLLPFADSLYSSTTEYRICNSSSYYMTLDTTKLSLSLSSDFPVLLQGEVE